MMWRVILIFAVILSWVLVTLGWCIILIIPAILGWALILSWLLDGAMWVRRKLHTAEEELDGLDQPEESGNHDGNRHRQTEILRSGASRNWLLWIARARTACQQSSGEFSSAASTTRRKDARFQINQVGSAFCFRPCGRLQHIQCTTTFNQAFEASTVPDRSA